ncbi:hypothetical protein ACAH01_06325 [Halomicrobium sp. HM KBTZ05]|uniref:DUF7269 family protein n=1 Tax=Halomicrobium TaxID=203135 RepID=UPI0014748246|nr:hypothetical protein [Halomicrobium mukohataei]
MTERDERVTDSATVTAETVDDEPGGGGRWRYAAGLGTLALVCALVVGVLPARYVPQVAVGVGETVRVAVLLGGGVVGLLGLYALSADDGATPRETTWEVDDENPVEQPAQDRPTGQTGTQPGRELDAELERIDGVVDEMNPRDAYRAYKIRQNLRELAVRVLTAERGWSASTARSRIESGRWTDDPRAAAFLSEGSVVPSVTLRLLDWARGDAFQRQVEATVVELAREMEVETP